MKPGFILSILSNLKVPNVLDHVFCFITSGLPYLLITCSTGNLKRFVGAWVISLWYNCMLSPFDAYAILGYAIVEAFIFSLPILVSLLQHCKNIYFDVYIYLKSLKFQMKVFSICMYCYFESLGLTVVVVLRV